MDGTNRRSEPITQKREKYLRHWEGRLGEQATICDDCGAYLPHEVAVWTTDGASYCPSCRPEIVAMIEKEGK